MSHAIPGILCNAWDIHILKIHSLLIWNSNLTGSSDIFVY